MSAGLLGLALIVHVLADRSSIQDPSPEFQSLPTPQADKGMGVIGQGVRQPPLSRPSGTDRVPNPGYMCA